MFSFRKLLKILSIVNLALHELHFMSLVNLKYKPIHLLRVSILEELNLGTCDVLGNDIP